MLIITRRPGEKIMIGDEIVIETPERKIVRYRMTGSAVVHAAVYREEIWEAVKAENRAAAESDAGLVPDDVPTRTTQS